MITINSTLVLGCLMKKINMKVIKIGIMSQQEIRSRTLAIAKGEYKPKSDEPKIWFTSIRSLAEILSDQNQQMLKIMMEKKPATIRELADMTGRRTSNLSRTLKTLATYGIVRLERSNKTVCPTPKGVKFNVIFGVPH